MQCEVYFKNGIRLVSSNELVKSVYNNPDIEKVVLIRDGHKFTVKLSPPLRLIFWRDIKVSSPKEVIYNIGFQRTVRGKNVKTIMKILPNNEIVLEGK